MSDRDLSIDPESPALQYEIVQDGWGRWRLERTHPNMPRTSDENLAVAEARNVLPTDEHDRLYVPDALRGELDAEPGDVVSLVTVLARSRTPLPTKSRGTQRRGREQAATPTTTRRSRRRVRRPPQSSRPASAWCRLWRRCS